MHNLNFNEDFQEWLEALENVILSDGSDYAKDLLNKVSLQTRNSHIQVTGTKKSKLDI